VTKWFPFRDTVEAAVRAEVFFIMPLPSGRELFLFVGNPITHLAGSPAKQSTSETSAHRLLTPLIVPGVQFEPHLGSAGEKHVSVIFHVTFQK
jgi:hypothetical protein